MHATIPKGNMGYHHYTVPDTVAVEPYSLSCTDERSENAPEQHGGSLQTRLIESMLPHVINIYGKRTGRP